MNAYFNNKKNITYRKKLPMGAGMRMKGKGGESWSLLRGWYLRGKGMMSEGQGVAEGQGVIEGQLGNV